MCSPNTFLTGVVFIGVGSVLLLSGYMNLRVLRTLSEKHQLKERNVIAKKLKETSSPMKRSGLFFV